MVTALGHFTKNCSIRTRVAQRTCDPARTVDNCYVEKQRVFRDSSLLALMEEAGATVIPAIIRKTTQQPEGLQSLVKGSLGNGRMMHEGCCLSDALAGKFQAFSCIAISA